MFERFTDRARRAIVLAQEEARQLDHNYIGTEHVLLGLVHEGDGAAARALLRQGVTLAAVRQQVEDIVGEGGSSPRGHIPFTPRAKKILELSLRESLKLGHDYMGTEHLLLGMLREGSGVGCQVLSKLGVQAVKLKDALFEEMGARSEDIPREVESSALLESVRVEAMATAGVKGHSHVGTDHLLLVLLAHPDAAATQALVDVGVDLDSLRARLEAALDSQENTSDP